MQASGPIPGDARSPARPARLGSPVSHRGAPRLRLAPLVGLVLAAALSAGCRVAGAHVHNLHQLHDPTGRHNRTGHLVSGLGYIVRYGARDLFGERSSLLQEGKIETFKHPLRSCLENVAKLSRIESRNQRVATAQVAALAWLAVDDPWNLTRETCVRALGHHGARLGVEVPPPRTAEPAGPPEVRDALAAVVAGIRKSPGQTLEEPAAGPVPALDAACRTVEAMELDREGALRLVRGLGALEAALRRQDPRAVRLRGTLAALERTLVAETLLLALKDEAPREVGGSDPGWSNPRVRAAAVEACVEAFGDTALGELVHQLDREREAPVVRAVLEAVAERGLPAPPEVLAAEDRARVTEGWIQRILLHAYDHPDGSVRVAAMRALSRISGGELHSLREEDWLAWYAARSRAAPREPVASPPAPGQEPRGS